MWILLKISLKFVPKGPINNIPSLVQVMAWRRPGNKPLSEPMMVSLLMLICVALPQWVNASKSNNTSPFIKIWQSEFLHNPFYFLYVYNFQHYSLHHNWLPWGIRKQTNFAIADSWLANISINVSLGDRAFLNTTYSQYELMTWHILTIFWIFPWHSLCFCEIALR